MTVTADGWLDWATRLYGNPDHVNGGINPVHGIFLHSAEGYAPVLLDPNSKYGYHGDLSWHLTNLMDGRLFQHFPLTAQCWHATAANNSFVGMENEGRTPTDAQGNPIPPGPPLNAAQIVNAKRVIADISQHYGWVPNRPTSAKDLTPTLWEHNEVVRIGGTSTSCPSGRIPWAKILGDDDMLFTRFSAGFKDIDLAALTGGIFNVRDLGIPASAKRVQLRCWEHDSELEVYDGTPDPNNRAAGSIFPPYGVTEPFLGPNGEVYLIGTGNVRVAPLGYWA